MNKQDKILRYGFTLFSVLTSFLFVYYAVSIIYGSHAANWLKIFAYVTGGYGLFNVYILSWAWRTQTSKAVTANLIIAGCFFGVVVMDLFRKGAPDGNQLGALAGLAAVLVINWFTVKKICQK